MSFSSPLRAACSRAFAASSYSALAMRARPHSRALWATPKNAPTHASGAVSASAAVGFAAHGAQTVAGGNAGRSAGPPGGGGGAPPAPRLSGGAPGDRGGGG